MKRFFIAACLTAAIAAVSGVVVSSAFAGGGMTVATCSSSTGYFLNGASVPGNLDIPAGTFCYLTGEFKGNVTVEGCAAPWGATFDKNVIVTGGWLVALGPGAEFMGNLIISGSNYGMSGVNALFADYAPITVHGNLIYTGNSVPLLVTASHPVVVNGNFNYSGNTVPWNAGQPLTVHGQSNVS
jgi:hypothetical protein